MRGLHVEHLGLAEQGVAMKDGVRVAQLLGGQVAIALPETSETDIPRASE